MPRDVYSGRGKEIPTLTPTHNRAHTPPLIYSRLVPFKTNCFSTTYTHTELIYSVCEYYSSRGSFPRNPWHKLSLSHYLMTKHSHKPPPMPLLNFTLRAAALENPPDARCTRVTSTHLHRKPLLSLN